MMDMIFKTEEEIINLECVYAIKKTIENFVKDKYSLEIEIQMEDDEEHYLYGLEAEEFEKAYNSFNKRTLLVRD